MRKPDVIDSIALQSLPGNSHMKANLFAVAALAVVGFTASANAAPIGLTKDLAPAVASETMLTQVHFRHRSCQIGYRGWHAHDRRGNRFSCRPRWRRY